MVDLLKSVHNAADIHKDGGDCLAKDFEFCDAVIELLDKQQHLNAFGKVNPKNVSFQFFDDSPLQQTCCCTISPESGAEKIGDFSNTSFCTTTANNCML